MNTAILTRGEARAVELVATGQVQELPTPRSFRVSSTTRPGTSYTVTVLDGHAVCPCRAERQCSHATAALLFLEAEGRDVAA